MSAKVRTGLILSLALGQAAAAFASGRNRDSGTSGGQFLKTGADARGVGLGGAMLALSNDAASVYWNPAGLARLDRRSATLTHAIHFQTIFQDFAAIAIPVAPLIGGERGRALRSNPLGTVGLGFLYLNAGSLPEYDNTGTYTGQSFTPRDYAVMAAWGGSITESLDFGLGAKYVHSQIDAEAETGALDLGLRYSFRIGRIPVRAALGAFNLGGNLEFISQADPLPLTLRAGMSVRPLGSWLIAAEVVAPKDKGPYPVFGTELRLPISEKSAAFLRAGYNGRSSAVDLEALASVAAGGGLRLGPMTIDYGWEPYGILEDSHRFTLSFQF